MLFLWLASVPLRKLFVIQMMAIRNIFLHDSTNIKLPKDIAKHRTFWFVSTWLMILTYFLIGDQKCLQVIFNQKH